MTALLCNILSKQAGQEYLAHIEQYHVTAIAYRSASFAIRHNNQQLPDYWRVLGLRNNLPLRVSNKSYR
jgi:hypothetical protein